MKVKNKMETMNTQMNPNPKAAASAQPMALDHDLHIHSQLSLCSSDPAQTPARILQYAKENGLREICLTDHCWDESVPHCMSFYREQGIAHLCRALPLPQADGIRFHFGCETDLNKYMELGLSPDHMDRFAWIVIPTTHLHMVGDALDEKDTQLDRLADLYVRRIDAVLRMDLPFHKTGLAHLTTSLLAQGRWEEHMTVLDSIPDATFRELFERAARLGMGIELNINVEDYREDELERVLRVYRIAHDCGCRFYFGSDAHHPEPLFTGGAKKRFAVLAALLDLHESDRFRPAYDDGL